MIVSAYVFAVHLKRSTDQCTSLQFPFSTMKPSKPSRTITATHASKRLVCPIAVWWRLRPLALTQRHFFCFANCKFQRLEAGSFMGSIAKRLIS